MSSYANPADLGEVIVIEMTASEKDFVEAHHRLRADLIRGFGVPREALVGKLTMTFDGPVPEYREVQAPLRRTEQHVTPVSGD